MVVQILKRIWPVGVMSTFLLPLNVSSTYQLGLYVYQSIHPLTLSMLLTLLLQRAPLTCLCAMPCLLPTSRMMPPDLQARVSQALSLAPKMRLSLLLSFLASGVLIRSLLFLPFAFFSLLCPHLIIATSFFRNVSLSLSKQIFVPFVVSPQLPFPIFSVRVLLFPVSEHLVRLKPLCVLINHTAFPIVFLYDGFVSSFLIPIIFPLE